MKRLLFLTLIVVLCLVPGASAILLDFQNPDDFSEQVAGWFPSAATGTMALSWIQNASGGNSFIKVTTTSGWSGFFINAAPLPMTYSAVTPIGSETTGYVVHCVVLDAAKMQLYGDVLSTGGIALGNISRVEFKMIGGDAYLYLDGVQVDGPHPLTQNPTYVGWGMSTQLSLDDVVWGSTESKYVFDAPADGYFLMKDYLNPAASGFYRVNQTDPNGTPTLMYSYHLPARFSKNSGTNQTIVLNEYGGGDYQNYYTGTNWAGEYNWNLTDFFSDSTAAPYGLYVMTIDGISPVHYSSTIPYIGSGAYIAFDQDSYATGEVATVDVTISDGYYDTATYDYEVVIRDVYGVEVSDQAITFAAASPHTGSVTYTWADDDDTGVYYGLINAVPKAGGDSILMNYDICELSSTFIVTGYVKNAETAGVIDNATVTVSQGVTTDTLTTDANGTFTSTSTFASGSLTTLTGSKTGFTNYTTTFTPDIAGTAEVNITLMPTSPTYTGIALGGIVRKPPFNQTVDDATVTIRNGTSTYTATTNGAGYYILNSMPNGTLWDVWGSKTGYSNSTTYQILVVGT